MTVEQKAKELAQQCFPDELNIWARANNEAMKVEIACLEMYKWTIERACEWLDKNLALYVDYDDDGNLILDTKNFVDYFKRRMEQ